MLSTNRRTGLEWIVVCLAAMPAGCDDSPAAADVCSKLLECTPDQPRERCDEAFAATEASLRPSAWADLSNCMVQTTCEQLLVDGTTVCLAKAADNAPSGAADRFLRVMCRRLASCGSMGGASESQCVSFARDRMQGTVNTVAILDDGAIDCLADCLEDVSCQQEDLYGACLGECEVGVVSADDCQNGTSFFSWCQCDAGYAGDSCSECAEDYRQSGDACYPTCTEDACSGHGQCHESGQELRCSCEQGYQGDRCQDCAEGYRRQGELCESVCRPESCSGRGSCDGSSGQAVCSCEHPYQGANCDACGGGYERSGGACVAPVQQVVSGQGHVCVRLAVGDVRCWGRNSVGQLGLGPLIQRYGANTYEPAALPPLTIGGEVTQLVAGWKHTCARLASGRVHCWGDRSYGMTGYGLVEDFRQLHPAEMPWVKLGAKALQLAAGQQHSCALLEGGLVRCWGRNHEGQLGYGHTRDIGDDELPTSQPPLDLGGKAEQIVVGGEHSCALLEGGVVRCWGGGWLGLPTIAGNVGDNEYPSAVDPVPLGAGVVQLSAGAEHTCARYRDGTVICWGEGRGGRLGNVTTADIRTPAGAAPVDVGGKVEQIAAAYNHTCALLEGGAVRCWGGNNHGQLGYGNLDDIGDDETPASAGDVDVGGKVRHISLGYYVSCALLESGGVRCWGVNSGGAFGHGHEDAIGDDEHPADAGDIPLFF